MSSSYHSSDLPMMEHEELNQFMILPTEHRMMNNEVEDTSERLNQPIGWNDSEINNSEQHIGKTVKKTQKKREKKILLVWTRNSKKRKRRTTAEVQCCTPKENREIRKKQNAKSSRKTVLAGKELQVELARSVLRGMNYLGDWTEEEQGMKMRKSRIQDQNNPNDDYDNVIQYMCPTSEELQDQLRLQEEMRTADFRYFQLLLSENPNISKMKDTAASEKSRNWKKASLADLRYENKRLEVENQRKKAYEKKIGVEQLVTESQLPILLYNENVTRNEIKDLAKCALELNEKLNGVRRDGWTLWDGATEDTHQLLEETQTYDGNIQFENEEVRRAKTLFDEPIPSDVSYIEKTVPVFVKSLEKTLYERKKGWYKELSEISLQEGENQRNKTSGTQSSQQFLKFLQAKLILYIAQLEIAHRMQVEAGTAKTVLDRQREQEAKQPQSRYVVMSEKEFYGHSKSSKRCGPGSSVLNNEEEMDLDDRWRPQCDTQKSPGLFTDYQSTGYQSTTISDEFSPLNGSSCSPHTFASEYTTSEPSSGHSVSDVSMEQEPNANDHEEDGMQCDYPVLASAPGLIPSNNEVEIDRKLAEDIEKGAADLAIERSVNKMRAEWLEQCFQQHVLAEFGSGTDYGSMGNFKDRISNERDCALNYALLHLTPKNDHLKRLKDYCVKELNNANPSMINPCSFDEFIRWIREKLERVDAAQVSRLKSAAWLAQIELECRQEEEVKIALEKLMEELQKFVNQQRPMG